MTARNTVLIVDDESLLVETIAFNLERRGFSVLKAYDGESGLKMALEQEPQMLILDVMMHHMSGWDVCRALRSSSSYGQVVPVLILTARSETRDRDKSLNAGATDYLTKPFSMQELIGRIQTLISGNNSG